MNVFVTGGTGFIGMHTVRHLRDRGHGVRCLVRDPGKAARVEALGATVVRGDVADRGCLAEGMRGCDGVVNLANLFEFWVADRREYARVNIEGTRNVLTAALEANVGKVVHVSTLAVWGNARPPITETTPFGRHCATEYARTKRAGDEVAWNLHRSADLSLVVVYPAGVTGSDDPKPAGRYVARLVQGAMPTQVLTAHRFAWVDVRDVATAIVRALEVGGNIGQRYILAAENLTFGDINRIVAEAAGVRLPRITLPDWLTIAGACLATGLANLIKKPPMLDMALDQMLLMREGLQADGSKAAEELGFSYTPIRRSLEDAVRALQR